MAAIGLLRSRLDVGAFMQCDRRPQPRPHRLLPPAAINQHTSLDPEGPSIGDRSPRHVGHRSFLGTALQTMATIGEQ